MLPVKIGIYGTATAVEETEGAIVYSPVYLVYDYCLHLDIAKCKSSKHTQARLEVNTKRQVSEWILPIPFQFQ